MANKMQALVENGPRIDPGKPAHNDDAVDQIMDRSGTSKGETYQSVQNFADMLEHFLKQGRSVHIDDLGTWWPEVRLDGDVNIHFRIDPELKDRIKTGFRGVLINAENIGKTMNDLIALWNANPAHADDQIPTS